MVPFIAKTRPRVGGEVMTLWSRGPADMCVIKGGDFVSCLMTSFVASASMMPEPAVESHGYTTPLDTWAVRRLWVARESSTTVDL
jgi:hypothetical protein